MRESTTKFPLLHINLSKLVNLLTSALFFQSLHIVVLGSSSLITLSRPSLTSSRLNSLMFTMIGNALCGQCVQQCHVTTASTSCHHAYVMCAEYKKILAVIAGRQRLQL